MTQQLLKRSEVEKDLTWDLSRIFKTEEDFEKSLKAFVKDVDNFLEMYKGKLKANDLLIKALKDYENILAKASYLSQYAMLPVNVDITDAKASARLNKVSSIISQESAKLSFFNLEVLQFSDKDLDKVATDNPEFKVWVRKTKNSKKAALSPEVEEAFELLSPTLNSFREIFEQARSNDPNFGSFEVDGKEYPLSFVLYEETYMYHKDPKVRRVAYDKFNQVLDGYKNTVATTYYNHVSKEKVISKMRGYDSVFDYLLKDQEVSVDMYNRQIDVIMEKFGPVMRKYISHIKAENNLEKMTYADLKIDIDPTYNQEITIEKTKDLVKVALAPMGSDYVDLILSSYDERWVDFLPNIGKRSGAFCSTTYKKHPFILMSFSNQLDDAYTLFHELGHAGQGILSHQNNCLTGSRPSLYLIEAPSTFHELLLSDYLKSQATTPRAKRAILSMMISKTYFHNFVTHLLEAAFQREVYRLIDSEKSFNANTLTKLKTDVLKKFWGNAVDLEDLAGLTWMRQPHYYMGLYPYTYSAGLTISTQAFLNIKNKKTTYKDWLEFLKMGGQEVPIDAVKTIGVDVSTDQALLDTINYLEEVVDEIINLSKEINNN